MDPGDEFFLGPAFAAEWRRQWGSDLSDLLAAAEGTPERLWGDFALSANLRGREMALDLAGRLSRPVPTLAGRTALDVGCGVGGGAVALASLGAATTGIDVDEQRVRLATANAVDHRVAVRFSADDVLDPAARERLGEFDVVVAEDVLEHVSDAAAGIRALYELLAAGGLARVTIPNGDAIPFVAADGHYLLPGLTLLRDPAVAAAYFDASFDWGEYDVGNYHSYDEYRAWFSEAGLGVADVCPIDVVDQFDAELEVARTAVARAADDRALPAHVREALTEGWKSYAERVAAARRLDPAEAQLRIGARFWRFYLTRGAVDRRWSLWPRRAWALRAALKQVPGLARVVGTFRR